MGPTPRNLIRPRERGTALIAILCVVAILAGLVFTATQFLFAELEAEANTTALFRAELLAERGIAIAGHPDASPGDPLLSQRISDTESYSARIGSEGEWLNLNALLEAPERDRIVLEQLFTRWGLRYDRAEDVVDNLIDWVDEDGLTTGKGAEAAFYLNRNRNEHPFNRPFRTLDEVELVNQFDLVRAANPRWREAFTLLGGGKLDLNEAPPELIQVACECGEVAAEALVEIRNQMRDGDEYGRFTSLEETLDLLGVPNEFRERIAARTTLDEPVRRITSVGQFGLIVVERTMTVQYNDQSTTMQKMSTRRLK